MKQSEVKELTTDELVEKMEVEAATLQKIKMMHVVSPLENPMQIRATRRNIARIKSELTRRVSNKIKG